MRPPPPRPGTGRSSSSTSISVRRSQPEPLSFARVSAAFREGRATPRTFLELCLGAVKRHEKSIQAFVTLDERAARKAADAATRRYKAGRPLSPVDGCPIAVKDIIATADMPTQMNSPIYKGWRPKSDAAAVAALRQAGGVIAATVEDAWQVAAQISIGTASPGVGFLAGAIETPPVAHQPRKLIRLFT